MLKILPDTPQRLSRRLLAGPLEQRLKAMQVTLELNLADALRDVLLHLCQDPNPKLRSKAVLVLGELTSVPADVLLDRVLNDTDARVRANAIEVLEAKQKVQYLPLLMQRARATNNRERANAIKALHPMRDGAGDRAAVPDAARRSPGASHLGPVGAAAGRLAGSGPGGRAVGQGRWQPASASLRHGRPARRGGDDEDRLRKPAMKDER